MIPNLYDIQDKEIFFLNFSPWKSFLRTWFPSKKTYFCNKKCFTFKFFTYYIFLIIKSQSPIVITWGYNLPSLIKKYLEYKKIPIIFMEDGFLRSIGLGAAKNKPYSITLDDKALYFDATQSTGLEDLLNNFDFSKYPQLIERAKHCIEYIIQAKLSKYNQSHMRNLIQIYGDKTKKRILVIGQVEDDASIQYGCNISITNLDLISIAIEENPNAEIIYKPHPDVWHGLRKVKSNVQELKDKCKILDSDIPIYQAFETIDHVYTITSLAGFEALLRNIKVTTIGSPFYAGWGVTDTRQTTPRRKRKLSVTEIFAVSYILYPTYFDYKNNRPCEIEDTINVLENARKFP